MRKTIMTTIGALFVMAIAVLGASVAFDNTPTAEARPTQSDMVWDLTTIGTMSVLHLKLGRSLRVVTRQRSVRLDGVEPRRMLRPPFLHLGHGQAFLPACLRHDVMWRSMQ